MYIKKIRISNYRNFDDFEMNFRDGLNVIVGANNSGKTGLLTAINLITSPEKITFNDFNKNNIQRYLDSTYKKTPPEIAIDYVIEHQVSEENTDDESIIKLLPFIGMKEVKLSKSKSQNPSTYTLTGFVSMRYSLNPKEVGRYLHEVKSINNDEDFSDLLERLETYYSWSYTNGISETQIDKSEAVNIFKVDFIDAERNSDVIYKETKAEIERFLKNDSISSALQDLRKRTSASMKDIIRDVLLKIEEFIAKEKNDIGLEQENISISQDIRPITPISNSYVIDVKDTKSNYILPLSHNGLGYNNLINIYMLIKLVEIKKGRDFRILCLEEPEAHLHPAMQYKLFKFLKKLDEENNLNQQIFVTTHSPNITAVAGLDNMFMLASSRESEKLDCKQQSLQSQLSEDTEAKKHMMKFLDVTRSDMLFADKVIFVEGLAEKLLLPQLMNKCDSSYEDNYISIVEIGGKHFSHFVRLFAENDVLKKVLCITDNDFKWIENNTLREITDYESMSISHVDKLKEKYGNEPNIEIIYQAQYGTTFEDELFMANIDVQDTAVRLLEIALPTVFKEFIKLNKIDFDNWKSNINAIPNGNSRKKVFEIITIYDTAITANSENSTLYKKLFFAKLFLEYAKDKKGHVALDILVDEKLMNELIVPDYIMEGIKWLSK